MARAQLRGTSIVWRFASARGDVTVDSVIGRGSVFTVTVPLAPAAGVGEPERQHELFSA